MFCINRQFVVGTGCLLFIFTAHQAFAASTITSLTTVVESGPSQTFDDVNGAGHGANFPESREYDLQFTGDVTRLDAIKAGGLTYYAGAQADFVFRRTNTPDNDIAWYLGAGNTPSTTLVLNGPAPESLSTFFGGNNLNIGVDNMFANRSDGNGNFSNIERVDFVFGKGVTAAPTRGFAVIDRGNIGDHDAFGIVAITGVDQAGNPSAYGTIKKFGTGAWGNTALDDKQDYLVLRKDNDEDGAVFAPSAHVYNTMGGVFIPLSDLAITGTTIYGFSLVGGDVNVSGNKLVDWSNTTYFPGDTLNDNDNRDANGNLINSSPGGLDPTGTLAMLYDITPPTLAPIPEPVALSLVAFLAMPLMARPRRR